MEQRILSPLEGISDIQAARAVVLSGALAGDQTLVPVEEVLFALLHERAVRVRGFALRDLPMAYCQGCFQCWTHTPGLCKTDGDVGHEIAAAVIASDLTVLLTPVTFGGYSSEIKKALDRAICLLSPFFRRSRGEVHHRRRYRRYPALAGVGVLWEPDPEQERIFKTLVERNARNLHSPAHAACVLPARAPYPHLRRELAAGLRHVLVRLAERAA